MLQRQASRFHSSSQLTSHRRPVGCPTRRYLSYRQYGDAAWHELSFCAAGTPQQPCAVRGRAADNLLAASHISSLNRTAYTLQVAGFVC